MPDSARLVVVTGLSGAGKRQALRYLEDLGYFCVDNLPASLIPAFAQLIVHAAVPRRQLAVCVDARGGEELRHLPAYVEEVAETGARPEVLFLESRDEVLLQRYSESRRRHPCAPHGSIEEGIARERELLEPIRGRADLLLDTSAMPVSELRERIAAVFVGDEDGREMLITVMSFGFKRGLPPEADLVFDVRFLPNPHYDEDLRPHSGAEPAVRTYVLENEVAVEFLDRLRGLLKHVIPHYAAEPKSYLTIAFGCTGGRHRSVAVAIELAVFLRELGYDVRLRHRDMEQGSRSTA